MKISMYIYAFFNGEFFDVIHDAIWFLMEKEEVLKYMKNLYFKSSVLKHEKNKTPTGQAWSRNLSFAIVLGQHITLQCRQMLTKP